MTACKVHLTYECVCARMHVYMCSKDQPCLYVVDFIHSRAHDVCMYICVCIPVCLCTCACACSCNMHTLMNVCRHTHNQTHAYMLTYTHVHTHTHTSAFVTCPIIHTEPNCRAYTYPITTICTAILARVAYALVLFVCVCECVCTDNTCVHATTIT